jgi:dTDP-4-dehydrorhamnose reductase
MAKPESAQFLRQADYVINCIGIIKPHCHDHKPDQVVNAIKVNAAFPHELVQFLADSSTKLLQIATDCVYSGLKGQYQETDEHDPRDVYGRTKSLGELERETALNIRCSIIGPELGTHLSLLEWFLSQPEGADLTGYQHHLWNGVTTLQFAELCEKIMATNQFESLRKTHYTHHFAPNTTVTKYELLNIFQSEFGTKFNIAGTSQAGSAVDRTLSSQYHQLNELYAPRPMAQALTELHSYMTKHNWNQYAR